MPIVKETLTDSEDNQIDIFIEVDEPASNPYLDLRGEGNQVIEAASSVFSKGMTLVRTCAEQVFTTMCKLEAASPSEFEVQISIKLDAELGAVLAKTSAEAQLQVTLHWSKSDTVSKDNK